jgi:dipeptidyl aminopeptidase/acylaminoacyl peptidase
MKWWGLALLVGCGGAARAPAPAALPVARVEAPAGRAREASSDPDDPPRDRELVRRAEGVTQAFGNGAGELTPDGKRLVFTSNRDGINTLYVADARDPAAPATPLVDARERIVAHAVTRDGKRDLFLSDRGADENWKIFLVDLDGKDLVELDAGTTQVRSLPVEPDASPGRAFFTARRKEEVATRLYEIELAPGAVPRRLLEAPQTMHVLDVTRDGREIAVVRAASRTENYVDLVDAATGLAQTIYPASGQAHVDAAIFSADGKRLYVATDGGGEDALLLALDVKTGRELGRYAENAAGASLDVCLATRQRDKLACRAVLGNHTELRLLDARTLRPLAPVQMPLGWGMPTSFSEDGARLLARWDTPTHPGDLYAVDVRSGKVAPLRKDVRPTLAALPAVDVQTTSIEAPDGLRIPIDVFRPEAGERPAAKRPVLVIYHGGPSAAATLGWSAPRMFWLSLGYAVVEPNVRGSGGFGRAFEMADNGARRLDAFKDVEAVGRWTAAQPWADKERLVIYGGSYGGYTALVGLTRMPDLWRAGVDLYGVVNMRTFLTTTTGPIRDLFKLELGEDREFLDSISPIRDVDAIRAPLFVYAGANDPRVPRTESDQIVRALRQRGVPVEYMVAQNEGHSLSRRENQVEFLARAARFLTGVLE